VDGGPYKCHVKNPHGESNAKLNLNIEAEPEPSGMAPTFIEKPRIESSADGKKVTMSCKVKADPKPSVVWTRESTVIRESSRVSISIVQEKDSYSIKLELLVSLLRGSFQLDYTVFYCHYRYVNITGSSARRCWIIQMYS